MISLNNMQQLQRPALTLANGKVYIAFGSYADTDNYHGWVLSYDATTLAQTAAWTAHARQGQQETGAPPEAEAMSHVRGLRVKRRSRHCASARPSLSRFGTLVNTC